jgi:hypothetical protein
VAATVDRAGRLPEPALRLRVDDEWSFVETLRHLVFATDKWAGRAILDEPKPYHPLGFPATGYLPADAAALSVDINARPSLAEVMEVPSPDYPQEALTVGRCLRVIMREECEHHRYAVRDLTSLEADPPHGLRRPGGRR